LKFKFSFLNNLLKFILFMESKNLRAADQEVESPMKERMYDDFDSFEKEPNWWEFIFKGK